MREAGVDNSRESVEDDGRIGGVRRKRRLPSPVAALLMLLAHGPAFDTSFRGSIFRMSRSVKRR